MIMEQIARDAMYQMDTVAVDLTIKRKRKIIRGGARNVRGRGGYRGHTVRSNATFGSQSNIDNDSGFRHPTN